MQKKNLLLSSILGIFLIKFASAYYYGYNNFSLTNLLNNIDSSTMILGTVFFLCFIFINFSLSKFFKGNSLNSGITSFIISLLITYGINKSNYNLENFFYYFGFSEVFLNTILPIVAIVAIIYLFIKLKSNAFFVIGGVLIFMGGFTEVFYESGTVIFIGGLLIIGGLIYKSWEKKGKEKKEKEGWKNMFGNLGN